jgi:predicted lipoprotein with Yx(FWY)xxD motif
MTRRAAQILALTTVSAKILALTAAATLLALAAVAAWTLAPSSAGGAAPAATAGGPAAGAAGASATAAARATVKVAESRFGRMLVDGRGLSLYLFTRDPRGRSRCYGDCAKAWPPLLTDAAPRAGSGARKRLLGTTTRRSGKLQVTYRGHPLYYYVGETRAGQVLCQGVVEFGGTWLVVSPSGRAIR